MEADPKSVAAQPHGSQAAPAGQNGNTAQGNGQADKAPASTSAGSVDGKAGSSSHDQESQQQSDSTTASKRARSASVLPQNNPAPAPTGVSLAEAAKYSDANASTDPSLAESIPPRSKIRLPPSPDYPGAVTRRAVIHRDSSPDLADLRKKLFLTRETESKLFDTKLWTRDLEKGYVEAWTRWVLGVDGEDSPETESLDPESMIGRRVLRSGHIWVQDL